MIVQTKAIVLSSLKFQDTSLIVKCYTTKGVKSYLLKGVLTKSKKAKLKPAYFQTFTLLQLTANHNDKGRLNYIKEAQVYHPFHSLHTNIFKSTIAIFLSEILSNVLREEEENLALFNYLESALIWLDTNDNFANFHLLFLLKTTKYLGFYPQNNTQNALFFNLKEGVFTQNKPFANYITNENLTTLKAIIGINFDAVSNLKISATNRQTFLSVLIDYFALHLPEFRKPKSLAVLQSVFK